MSAKASSTIAEDFTSLGLIVGWADTPQPRLRHLLHTVTTQLEPCMHVFLSWHTFTISFVRTASTIALATSFYLFLTSWHALFFLSSTSSTLFGTLSSSVRPTCPRHLSCYSITRSDMVSCIPKTEPKRL